MYSAFAYAEVLGGRSDCRTIFNNVFRYEYASILIFEFYHPNVPLTLY